MHMHMHAARALPYYQPCRYRSVPPSGQALVENSFKPFNSFIQPARPQEIEDVAKPPVLVMKVW